MDVVLKVRTRTGKHTFREDVYMCTLKYRRQNNELRTFQSLKRRVTNIFQKQNLLSDETVYTLIGVISCQWMRKQNTKGHVEGNQTLLVSLPHLLLPLLKLQKGLPSL